MVFQNNHPYRYRVQLFVIGLLCVCNAFAKAELEIMPCAMLTSPQAGATNVSIIQTIFFEPIPGAVSYFVDLGTTPGGTDILNNFSAGSNNEFSPPQGFPESTEVFITIRGFFDNGTTTTCDAQSFTTEDNTIAPNCTQLEFPINGAVDVPIETVISWPYAPRATGYILNVGTTPGGTDVINSQDVGNVLSFNFPFDLESETTYYVTIIPFNENGQITGCSESSFTTEVVASEVPECAQLFAPEDGAIEVALTPILSWPPVTGAEGYLIKVGSAPGGDDVLGNTNIGLQTSTAVIDFDEGTTYYVTITPFNAAGEAVGCVETSFTTTFGCGPYIDGLTGEEVDLNPVINLPDSFDLCTEEAPLVLNYTDPFTTITWYEIVDGNLIEIATVASVVVEESGSYLLEVNLEAEVEAGIIICTSTHSFEVSIGEGPIISNLRINNLGNIASVLVELENDGDFEYSGVSANGPYQSSPLLTGLDVTDIEVFVRDLNGCGIDSRRIRPDPGFPKYFTPNGDGINDTWQVRGVVVNGETITSIEIYDRYGKRLTTILPVGLGWDGTYNGQQLLDAGYWYKANTRSAVVFTGFFALRRF